MVKWLTAHLTVAFPEDEWERIKKHPDIKWGGVARRAVIRYLDDLEKANELLEKHTEKEKQLNT